MKPKASLAIISSLTILAGIITPTFSSANGGTDCAACVILVSLAEQLAQVHSTDIVSAADKLCSYLPSPLNIACTTLLNEYGQVLIDMVDQRATADLACHDIGVCTQDPNKDFCHLYPLPSSFDHGQYAANRPAAERFHSFKYNFCNLPGVKELCDGINRVSEHKPIQDNDDDGFSEEVNVLRGAFWKGRDCDGKNPSYYPGRLAINSDRIADSNCNGIYGVDPKSGIPFEDLYCNKTQQRGIVILGDSAGAHFRIPENYLMAEVLSENTFQDAVTLIANEGDWPMLSSTTAMSKENSWPQSIRGPIDSLYLRLREHNLCNHRDYQNIGVNGARSSSMNTIVKSLSRRRPFDKPQIVMLSLIGNDVCNGHVDDTIAHMTTPTDFRDNTMVTLKYLDSVLPKNSSVLITGLADGRFLWNLLSKRYHPLGHLNRDVTYTDIYKFLNCLEVSPCSGWMSTNESLRNFTSERAANLSIVAQSIANKEKFMNFDIHYIDFNIQAIIKMWQKQGGEAWEVIEPVDGFHPGQIAQALSAEYTWNQLQTKYPHVLGPANPYNNKIKEVFGNQGGH